MDFYLGKLLPQLRNGEDFNCSYCPRRKINDKTHKDGFFFCELCRKFKCNKCVRYEVLDGRAVIAYKDGSRFEGFYTDGKR